MIQCIFLQQFSSKKMKHKLEVFLSSFNVFFLSISVVENGLYFKKMVV